MAELMDRKRLIEYLPRFMQNFSELKELLNIANDETDVINIQVGRILDEAFIDSCTEYGLRKYEMILGVLSDARDSVKVRKNRIKNRWNIYAPHTYRNLAGRLEQLCGEKNFALKGDLTDYFLHIQVNLDQFSEMGELRYLAESMLPGNIYCLLSGSMSAGFKIHQNITAGICFSTRMDFWNMGRHDGSFLHNGEILHDLKRRYDLRLSMSGLAGAIRTDEGAGFPAFRFIAGLHTGEDAGAGVANRFGMDFWGIHGRERRQMTAAVAFRSDMGAAPGHIGRMEVLTRTKQAYFHNGQYTRDGQAGHKTIYKKEVAL